MNGLALGVCALVFAAGQGAPPLPPQAPVPARPPVAAQPKLRHLLVVLDDRSVPDQAPAAFLDRALAELARRKGIRAERMSALRAQLDARDAKALATCGEDAGCLATAARAMGADFVVSLRLTRREGEEARFLATTRINALRPQIQEDSGAIVGSEKEALPLVGDQVAELFPELELK